MDSSIKVYVTNLSQFEYDGLIIGSWFTLPVSLDEVREKLQMKTEDGYEIEDWEAPFRIVNDKNLEELNLLANLTEDAKNFPAFQYVEELYLFGAFSSLEEGLEHVCDFSILDEKPQHPIFLDRTYKMSDGTLIMI